MVLTTPHDAPADLANERQQLKSASYDTNARRLLCVICHDYLLGESSSEVSAAAVGPAVIRGSGLQIRRAACNGGDLRECLAQTCEVCHF